MIIKDAMTEKNKMAGRQNGEKYPESSVKIQKDGKSDREV